MEYYQDQQQHIQVLYHHSFYPVMAGMPVTPPVTPVTRKEEDEQVRKHQRERDFLKGYRYRPRAEGWKVGWDFIAENHIFNPEEDAEAMTHYFKSHIYSALGAVLHLDQSMIVWIDMDIGALAPGAVFNVEKKVTNREYYAGPMKKRPYHYSELSARDKNVDKHTTFTYNLALTQALQMRRLNLDCTPETWEELERDFGLVVNRVNWSTVSGTYYGEVLTLTLDKDLVRRTSTRANLVVWLNMDASECPIQQTDTETYPPTLSYTDG